MNLQDFHEEVSEHAIAALKEAGMAEYKYPSAIHPREDGSFELIVFEDKIGADNLDFGLSCAVGVIFRSNPEDETYSITNIEV